MASARAVQWLQQQGSPGGTGRNGSTGARTRATLAARAARAARAVGAIRTSIVGVGMGRRGKGGIATETETDLTIGPTIGRMTDAGEKRDPVIVEMVGGPMIDVVIDVMIDVMIDVIIDVVIDVMIGETVGDMKGAMIGETTAGTRIGCMMSAMSTVTVDGTSIAVTIAGKVVRGTGEKIAGMVVETGVLKATARVGSEERGTTALSIPSTTRS